jgi:hypothetical protein
MKFVVRWGKLSGAIFEFEGGGLARGLRGFLTRLDNGREWPGNFRNLIQLNDASVGNLPPKRLNLALLLVALFQKYGLARIGGHIPGGWHNDVSSAVRHHDAVAYEV